MFNKKKTIIIKMNLVYMSDEEKIRKEKELAEKIGCNVVIIDIKDEVIQVG